MRVRVERCWTGHSDRFRFRITLPDGSVEIVADYECEGWTRKKATEALDLLENVYGIKRRNVRFVYA